MKNENFAPSYLRVLKEESEGLQNAQSAFKAIIRKLKDFRDNTLKPQLDSVTAGIFELESMGFDELAWELKKDNPDVEKVKNTFIVALGGRVSVTVVFDHDTNSTRRTIIIDEGDVVVRGIR